VLTLKAILALSVSLLTAMMGFVYWAYRRGRKEGAEKSTKDAIKKFHKDVINLVNDPNSLFNIVRKPKDKKD
jgi:hypothetical protein